MIKSTGHSTLKFQISMKSLGIVFPDDINKNVFLLSEHVPCKESIVIMKKFDYEILIYLYVLRYSDFIYAIFTVVYVCMYVCVCVCMCGPIASERCIRLS